MMLQDTLALSQDLLGGSKTPSVVKKEQVSAADDIFETLLHKSVASHNYLECTEMLVSKFDNNTQGG
jgi:hypothetical protein